MILAVGAILFWGISVLSLNIFNFSYTKITLGLILASSSLMVNAQQKTLAKFIITDASVNGVDITPTILDQGAYTVFYTINNDRLIYMANCFSKDDTHSYGPIYSSEQASYNETHETYKADIFYYNWRYINDYDSKKGTAKIQFTKIYKPQGVTFILKVIPENLDIIIYKGYMEGTIDFSKYN